MTSLMGLPNRKVAQMAKVRYKNDLVPPDNSAAKFQQALISEEPFKREGTLIAVDYSEVDKTIIRLIENGDIKLTDKLFFNLLKESPQYLACEVFQRKIALWQTIFYDDTIEKRIRYDAKDMLTKIGNTLSFVGSGLRSQIKNHGIYLDFVNLERRLAPIIMKTKKKYFREKEQIIKKEAPDIFKEYLHCFFGHRAPKAIAKEIICEKYGISNRHLHRIIKYYI
jgi:hypothetical protein